MPATLPPDFPTSRDALHRVAVHVLARRRFAASGRFGLRPTPGGFGTPAFGGPDHEEVLRVAGPHLVREERRLDGTHTSVHPIAGASLGDLARFAGADLDVALSVGTDTPDVGDRDAPLTVSDAAAEVVARWYDDGARALDALLARRAATTSPSVFQLWPEHFDLGGDLASGTSRVNLGASAGDGYHDAPYVYVGPWTGDRPGDPAYWNAPFGALLGWSDVVATPDPLATMIEFFERGLALLAG